MEELKCPLCKKQYTEVNPPRLLTMCGHTYCQECLKTLIKRKDYRFQIRCPEDKLKLTIDSSTPLQFPRNMILVEAIAKTKPKIQVPEDRNQFLAQVADSIPNSHRSRTSKQGIRSSAFTTKRNSQEEGVCLLHQKNLDIICLQQKISICAECALFGLHKGHTFTTIRDLEAKRIHWINSISHIMEEKKIIQEKQTQSHIQAEIARLITKKKEGIQQDIDDYYKRLREALDNSEKQVRAHSESQIDKIADSLKTKVLRTQTREKFRDWESSILETIMHLQSDNVIKSIDIYADLILGKRQNFICKGNTLLQTLTKEFHRFWEEIQASLEYPKLSLDRNTEQYIANIANIQLLPKEKSQRSIIDFPSEMKSSIICSLDNLRKDGELLQTTRYEHSQSQDQVSLLDIEDHFQSHLNLSSVSLCQDSFIKDSSHIQTPSFVENTHVVDNYRSFKKAKTKEITTNKSLVNLHENRMSMNSPKLKKKTEYLSRGLIPSALSPPPKSNLLSPTGKDKLKKVVFRAKDPEKFERLLKAMDSDCSESLDFTGLELGNQIIKQVCLKLKQCKKVKTVRLMKNMLSDDCIPSLIQSLSSVQSLNLAQNQFSSRILDCLLQFGRRQKVEKPKNIQLGQNNINSRKHKEKIQEMKRYGIMISL